jgi:hypothetical protein
MSNTPSLTETAIKVLNEAFTADPSAMHAFMCNRVPCNKALAHHHTIPVQELSHLLGTDEPTYMVTALGLINGILAATGSPLLAVQFSDNADEFGISQIVGFQEYKVAKP